MTRLTVDVKLIQLSSDISGFVVHGQKAPPYVLQKARRQGVEVECKVASVDLAGFPIRFVQDVLLIHPKCRFFVRGGKSFDLGGRGAGEGDVSRARTVKGLAARVSESSSMLISPCLFSIAIEQDDIRGRNLPRSTAVNGVTVVLGDG